MMQQLLKKHYGFNVNTIHQVENGVGGETYTIDTDQGVYILKRVADNGMNHPQNEPLLVETLVAAGIPVARFVPTLDGEVIWTDDRGQMYHLQQRILGSIFTAHTAPDWLLWNSARLLGRIHQTLTSLPSLPVGIGDDFFRLMTPQRAESSYQTSLQWALQAGEQSIVRDLQYRIKLLPFLQEVTIDIQKFSRGNTHGDYGIHQIICAENHIQAVIDWTSACVHPFCWEVIRSFSYAEPSCRDGVISNVRFQQYLENYLSEYPLSGYDLRMMPYLYMYQLGVSDYYHQYFTATTSNRQIFLFQACFSTRLLNWFERHVEDLSRSLEQ